MAQVWDGDEQARGARPTRGARGETLVYDAATDRTAYRRTSGGRRKAQGVGQTAVLPPSAIRLPPAPQAIGPVLVLLAGLGAMLLMCAVLWVGLGVGVTVLLRLLGP